MRSRQRYSKKKNTGFAGYDDTNEIGCSSRRRLSEKSGSVFAGNSGWKLHISFSESKKARPKSLIKRNELKNPGTVDLILRKTTGSLFFDEIIVGDTAMLKQFREKLRILCQQSCLKM